MSFVILYDANEELVDRNQTQLMAQRIPDAELEIIPDIGHFAMFAQPEEFNQIVLTYLGM